MHKVSCSVVLNGTSSKFLKKMTKTIRTSFKIKLKVS
jgi:hypothetical protein